MKISSLANAVNLIEKLDISIKDNKTPYMLAEDLLEEFPDYEVTTVAYRAIKGEWDLCFENIHWSHSLEGSRACYKSIYGNLNDCNYYKARLKGFDVHRFWNDISDIEFFRKLLTFTYVNEEEIMVIEVLSRVERVIKESGLEESA